ncbi:MAG TPA: hypothetical protein VNO24_18085 [Blastocatellia bacterium]|nr:hypothetical protein [Blastocatellia bacterium]
MKRTKTKTEITVATRQRITIRRRSEPPDAWCERCGAQVQMLAPLEVAALLQTTARAIFRGVEAGELHFLETADGGLLVCRNSLNHDLRNQILGGDL